MTISFLRVLFLLSSMAILPVKAQEVTGSSSSQPAHADQKQRVTHGKIQKNNIPDTLKPWIPWVMVGQEKTSCPWSGTAYECAGVGVSILKKTDLKISLNTKVTGFHPQKEFNTLPLPFSEKSSVRILLDGKDANVVIRESTNYLLIPEGTHQLRIEFDTPSDIISWPLPWNSAVWDNGYQVVEKNQKLLWQEKTKVSGLDENSMTLRIFRKFEDTQVPMIETYLSLNVGGSPRWETLSNVLPQNYSLVSFESALPIVLDTTGSVKVKTAPGQHTVVFKSRCMKNCDKAGRGSATPFEVWSFESHPEVRQTQVSGTSIDPVSMNVPDNWRKLPSYKVDDKTHLLFKTLSRGGRTNSKLSVNRTAWLDRGVWFVEDTLQGETEAGKRLELPKNHNLLSFEQEGQNVPISINDNRKGVNLTGGTLNAVARYTTTSLDYSSGWNVTADQVQQVLHTIPNKKIVHISGQTSQDTWVSKLSVWIFFWGFVLFWIVKRTLGTGFALLASALFIARIDFIGLIVFVSFLLFLSLLAVTKKFPEQKQAKPITGIVFGFVFILLFGQSVLLARDTVYPQLNISFVGRGEVAADAGSYAEISQATMEMAVSKAQRVSAPKSPSVDQKNLENFSGVVQAGAAAPIWTSLYPVTSSSSGPVEPKELQRVFVLPSLIWSLLMAAWIFGWGFVFWATAKRYMDLSTRFLNKSKHLSSLGIVLFLALTGTVHAQETPAPDILNEMREKLTAPPPCKSECTTILRVEGDARDRILLVRMVTFSQSDTLIPLPATKGMDLRDILVDNDKGFLGIGGVFLTEGQHTIVLSYLLSDQSQISFSGALDLSLPQKSNNLSVTQNPSGWVIQRTATEEENKQTPKQNVLDLAQGYAEVERTILFGNEISVRVRMTRKGPLDQALTTKIPAILGETSRSSLATRQGNFLVVDWKEGQQEISFDTQVPLTSTISLKAMDTQSGSEVWIIKNNALWTIEDLPFDSHQNNIQKTLYPFPSETLLVKASKPVFADGSPLRINSVHIESLWGEQIVTHTAKADVFATQASEIVFGFPEGTKLRTIQVGDQPLALQLQNNKLTVPVSGGQTHISFEMESKAGGVFAGGERWTVSEPVGNSIWKSTRHDRLMLWVSGDGWGTSVFYWPFLLVYFLLAFLVVRFKILNISYGASFLLAAGFSLFPSVIFLGILAWIFLIDREKNGTTLGGRAIFVTLTVLVAISVLFVISAGLIGAQPNMHLKSPPGLDIMSWYNQSPGNDMTAPFLVTLPMWVYRIIMCAWGLWLAKWCVDRMQAAFRIIMAGRKKSPEETEKIDDTKPFSQDG